jgi:hypothetical protein
MRYRFDSCRAYHYSCGELAESGLSRQSRKPTVFDSLWHSRPYLEKPNLEDSHRVNCSTFIGSVGSNPTLAAYANALWGVHSGAGRRPVRLRLRAYRRGARRSQPSRDVRLIYTPPLRFVCRFGREVECTRLLGERSERIRTFESCSLRHSDMGCSYSQV